MKETTLTILNEEGLHARPAGVLAKAASGFKSQIEIVHNQNTVNAKSIMALMGLGLTKDAQITLRANGDDADLAIEKIAGLINNKFQIH
jgi:phosphocarrier protein